MLFFLLFTACRNTEKINAADSVTEFIDQDNDGFAAPEDCDDNNPDIRPDAEEICDTLDNDCDEDVDEDLLSLFYADEDADGFGDAENPLQACDAPDGYISNAEDCDDNNPDIRPDAEEICDTLDNDCDEDIDEDVQTILYADADQDGFGDPQNQILSCLIVEGHVLNDSDCDDTNPDIRPDAEEICDTLDNDCDEDIDEGVQTQWFLDDDNDGYGSSDNFIFACDPPDDHVLDNTDCDDLASDTHPNAEEFCDLVDNDCDEDIDESDATDALQWYADVDGDGFGDANSSQPACEQPSAHVLDNTDCDDNDGLQYPEAPETPNGEDDDCDDTVDEGTIAYDDDGDGFSENDGDCNDADINISPAVTEVVNNIDDDCDGTIDNDTIAYDDDGDGFSENDGDCDDADINVSPEAEEFCNTIDDNCDGIIDEDDAIDALTYYLDFDADGFGDPTNTQESCTQPSGHVLDDSDCDDNDEDLLSINDDADCDGTPTADDCDDGDSSLNDLDLDGDGGSSCDGDCNDSNASLSISAGGGCPMGASCLDIVGGVYDQGDGVYTIDPDGSGGSAAYNVYCDMSTNGGGWTALVNPVGVSLSSLHPNLSHAGVAISGTGSCYPNTSIGSGNSWYAVQGYACGVFTGRFTLSWVNDIGATDLMFVASLQGQQTHTLSVNGANLSYTSFSNAYMKCAFWNGNSSATSPGTNGCWNTHLNAPPKVYNNQFSGNLSMVITTGQGCSPDCAHGTGFNVQKLFVR